MHMVGHDDPVIEKILLFVKVSQSCRDQAGYVRATQMTRAHALIQVTFNFALQGAVNLFGFFAARIGARQSPRFCLLGFETKQNFLRQGIGRAGT